MTEYTTPGHTQQRDPWIESDEQREAPPASEPKRKAAPHTSWPQAEKLFSEWRIQYDLVPEFPLADIQDVAGQQVRDADNRANPDAVAQYVEHYKAGSEFPPIVLARPGSMIDGNTRRAMAEKVHLTHFPAYVVSVPSMAYAQAVGAAFNQMNGHRLSEEEALREAAKMLDDENLGFTDQQIASAVGRPIHQIRKWRTNNEVFRRAQERGKAAEFERIPAIQRAQLAKVKHAEPFDALLDLASSRRMKNADMKSLVEEVVSAESDAAAMAAIEEANNALLPGGPKGIAVVQNKKAFRMRMLLPQVLNLEPFEDLFEPEKAVTDQQLWLELVSMGNKMLDAYAAHGYGDGARGQ